MKRLVTVFLATAVLLCAGGLTTAAPVIDQSQPNNFSHMAAFAQSDLAQSFQQAHDNVAGAGIFLQQGVGTSDMVTISLWDNLPNQGGTMLTGSSVLGTSGSWLDVFWAPVAVIPDTTLYLVFTSANDTLGISGDTSNPYPRGQVYANPGFGSFPTFDYTFRTYYDDGFSVIPAPGAMLLGMLGTGLVGYFRRRRAL